MCHCVTVLAILLRHDVFKLADLCKINILFLIVVHSVKKYLICVELRDNTKFQEDMHEASLQ
jgi:hypothetical protein